MARATEIFHPSAQDGRGNGPKPLPPSSANMRTQAMHSGVAVPGSVNTTSLARPGADQAKASWWTWRRRSASPAASRLSPQRAIVRRVKVTPGCPRSAASQINAVATCRTFDLPAILATASSQSKRAGPMAWTEVSMVRVERSEDDCGMVRLQAKRGNALLPAVAAGSSPLPA